jgi:GTP-binding protein
MFYDQATISVRGGRGGDGSMNFRRESMVPMGGPDGGNGGRGGDVVFIVNRNLNTLNAFQHKRQFEADDGRRGRKQNMTGRSGKPLFIEVPPGTVVRDADTGDLIGDLTHEQQRLIAAKGGKGGRGNATYATAHNQAPRMAENGAPGEYRELKLELKLIADIGFVGLPNAGKSTLLASLTAAKPKIANYPFTTLQPNLGVAQVDMRRVVVLADIPGLIEGASQGTGLGHEFLRHIERTRVLIHLIDGMSDDPVRDYETIQAELAAFGHGLAEKPQVVALTKMDLPDAQAAHELYASFVARHSAFAISAATGNGVRELLLRAVEVLDGLPPLEEPEIVPELTMDDEALLHFEVSHNDDGSYKVSSPMLERRAEITRWDLDEAVQKFQRALENSGIGPELQRRGVKPGDLVYIGDYELEWGEG